MLSDSHAPGITYFAAVFSFLDRRNAKLIRLWWYRLQVGL